MLHIITVAAKHTDEKFHILWQIWSNKPTNHFITIQAGQRNKPTMPRFETSTNKPCHILKHRTNKPCHILKHQANKPCHILKQLQSNKQTMPHFETVAVKQIIPHLETVAVKQTMPHFETVAAKQTIIHFETVAVKQTNHATFYKYCGKQNRQTMPHFITRKRCHILRQSWPKEQCHIV